MKSAVIYCLIILSGFSKDVFGTNILDQSQTDFSSGEFVHETVSVAQTFTPSVTGTFAELDLFMANHDTSEGKPLIVSIYDTVNGVPNEPLGTLNLNNISGDYYAWYKLDFSSLDISLNANSLYSFVLSCPGSFYGIYPGGSVNPNSYTRGMALIQGEAGSSWQPDRRAPQLMFQTYMNVPEPRLSILLLFAAGLLGFRRLSRAA